MWINLIYLLFKHDLFSVLHRLDCQNIHSANRHNTLTKFLYPDKIIKEHVFIQLKIIENIQEQKSVVIGSSET